MAELKMLGLTELSRNMKTLPDRIAKNALNASARAGATHIVKEIRSRTPKRSGTLRKAIAHKKRRGNDRFNVTYDIGVRRGMGAYYWYFVEFGSIRHKPVGMIRKGFERSRDTVLDSIRVKLGSYMEREATKRARR